MYSLFYIHSIFCIFYFLYIQFSVYISVVEPLMIFGFAYEAYVLAEMFHFSGIIRYSYYRSHFTEIPTIYMNLTMKRDVFNRYVYSKGQIRLCMRCPLTESLYTVNDLKFIQKRSDKMAYAYTADPDQTASTQGLHCLPFHYIY